VKYSDLGPAHDWRERCHPEDRVGFDQRRQALLEGRSVEAEFRVIDAGRRIRWLHAVAQPFTDPATGKVTSVIGVCDDITARKNAELALQKSESILRSVTDNVPDWLLLVDLDLNCRFANRGFLGRSPAELVGCSVLELTAPAEREALAGALAHAVRSSTPVTSYLVILVDGGQRHFEMRAAPALEQAAVTGLTVTITEITERRLAEAALRTQASILETMREGVAVIARDGAFRLTNPAFDQMFGYAPGEVAGMPVAALLGDVEFAASERDRLDFLERNRRQPIKRDLLLRRQDGTLFTGEAVITSLELGTERVWLAVVQDITERKALEHEIIESANREQQRIGSDLHDGLGQELTGVALMLRGLTGKMRKGDPELTPLVDEIVALVNHTIESARALARGLSPVSLDRGGLVVALQNLVTRASEMYGVEVRLRSRVSPRLTLDEAASNHLYRIAQEAVTNAVRHGQASQITVQLLVEERNVRLTISDNGRGLPQGPADEPRHGASGMGLKIMAYRARMIGGEVTVERLREGGIRVRCRCRQPAPDALDERRS
jgi:PAS domain S-box-containing protein